MSVHSRKRSQGKVCREPLSQTGLRRVRKNAGQREFSEGGVKVERDALDQINERLASEYNRTLHPTKGFRKLNAKRSVAERIVADIRAGNASFSTDAMKRELSSVSN